MAGTYAAVWPDAISNARLKEYFSKALANVVDDFHITTTYSTVELPELKDKVVSITLNPAMYGYDLFGDARNCLVLTVKHPSLRELWKKAMNMGASWSYRDYQAHITISSDFDGRLDGLPPLPTFPLHFNKFRVDELKD